MANYPNKIDSKKLINSSKFGSIVLEKRALLDVRAPIEFAKGSFPEAVNIPLLDDKERELVGIKYKNEGNEAAVKLGYNLISGVAKEDRLREWSAFIKKYPDAYLYCFRGGQRSGISQQWLAEAGISIPRLEGGYKAFRGYLIEQSELLSARSDTLIIGGRTGSGKTVLLKKMNNAIDLEGIANHRGSSFGRHVTPQPTQVEFENALAYKLIELDAVGYKNLIIEHESHNIGRVHIPNRVFENFNKGRLIILQTQLHERVDITYDEYVLSAIEEHIDVYGKDGVPVWSQSINAGLDRIAKRLGGKLHAQLKKIFAKAYEIQNSSGDLESHKQWIEILLSEYYDPMYDYQISKSQIPIIHRGDAKSVLDTIEKVC